MKQDPPFAVQIELVEGCCLNCKFCGVQGIRVKRGDYKYMEMKTVSTLTAKLRVAMRKHNWNPRLELAMHGEPTMHPDLLTVVGVLASLSPRMLCVVSNGGGLVKDTTAKIDALVAAGLKAVCLDQYAGCDFVPRILANYKGALPVVHHGHKDSAKFWGGSCKEPYIIVKQDVATLTGPYEKLNTHCGGGGKPVWPNPAINKRCAKPFRELAVRWDGNVSLCCNDFRGIYKVGNVCAAGGLERLWQAAGFAAARQMLYAGDRNFVPCKWCDAISARVGLLPDKLGRRSLPPPTDAVRRVLGRCVAGLPYTPPVLRGWEASAPCLPPGLPVVGLPRQPIDHREGKD